MSGVHAHALYVHGHSPVHQLPPECKIAAQIVFVFAVVATPREAFWAFAIDAAIVAGVIALAGLRPGFVLRRLVVELPFVAFALFLPLVGRGERVDAFGSSLSVEGLWGTWNILAKATLGVATAIVVAATTTMPEFLRGFDRLHAPRALTSIASFMIRYADVISDEVRRMRVARESRGFGGRWIWHARAVAASAGTLFIRSYERGERVYLAMVSRGYPGAMPDITSQDATSRDWLAASLFPAAAAVVAVTAWALVR